MARDKSFEQWASQFAGYERDYVALSREEELSVGKTVWDIGLKIGDFERKVGAEFPEYIALNGEAPDLSHFPKIGVINEYNMKVRERFERARVVSGNPRNNLEMMMLLRNKIPLQREADAIANDLNSNIGYFYRKNVNIVLAMSWFYNSRNKNIIELNAFTGEALEKLEKSVNKFDFTQGFKFSSYVSTSVYRAFLKEIGRPNRVCSLDYIKDETGNFPIHFNRELDPVQSVILKEGGGLPYSQEVKSAIRTLSPIEQKVILLRFGFEGEKMTLKQTGEIIGARKDKVRKIQLSALAKLRPVLEDSFAPIGNLASLPRVG